MKPADEHLAEALRQATINEPRIPVYSNVTALPHAPHADSIRQILADQVTTGVRWEASVRRMIADGFDAFYEIGPGRVLTGLLKRIDRKMPCNNIPAR
jgi:[acyl-carrier-protein] S-malonyltransferase